MKEILKNKKMIIYILIALIIVAGIISIFVRRLNYTLMYSEHTQINVYLSKSYDLNDIKDITKEVLGNQEIEYQEIETFHDSIAINVKEINDEQLEQLTTKLKEKYEISEEKEIIETKNVAHLRGIDILNPYIAPMTIATILVLAYVGIRYSKLNGLKVILTLLLRLVGIEALLLSVIAIFRIPIGAWTMPVVVLVYMLIIICTTAGFENIMEANVKKEKKK